MAEEVPTEKIPEELKFVPEDKIPESARRRLGPGETEEEGPKDLSAGGVLGRSFGRQAYNFMGRGPGIGGTAGAVLGTALGPSTGGLSILVPALTAAAGGGFGAIAEGEGKSPYKEGAKEGLLQGATGGLARVAKPAFQYAKGSVMKTFGGRAGVSEAAESLFKKWFAPQVAAETLYKRAAASGVHVPLSETATVIDDVLKNEVNRMPTKAQAELKDLLEPLQNFVTPTVGKTKQRFLISQPVTDSLADIRRLSAAAREAFGGKNPNTDLGNAINRVRAAMFDDLEKVGVPEAREASKHYRRQMAIETLSEQISRPIPGVKLRDAYRKNALFDKSFDPAEKAQIDRIVRKLDTVTPSGLSGAFGKMITTGVGAVIGAPFGPIGHAVGSVAGYVGAEQIRELLASPAGRDFMERTLADSYRLGSGKVVQTLGPAWAIFARGLMSGTEDPQQPEQ